MNESEQPKDYPVREDLTKIAKLMKDESYRAIFFVGQMATVRVNASELLDLVTDYLDRVEK